MNNIYLLPNSGVSKALFESILHYCCQLLLNKTYKSNNMQYFSMKIHKSCYIVYKYSSLRFSAIIFADSKC